MSAGSIHFANNNAADIGARATVSRNLSFGYYDAEGHNKIDTISRRVFHGEAYIEINGANLRDHKDGKSQPVQQIEQWASQHGIGEVKLMRNSGINGAQDQYQGRMLLKTGDIAAVAQGLNAMGLASQDMANFITAQESNPVNFTQSLKNVIGIVGPQEMSTVIQTGEGKELVHGDLLITAVSDFIRQGDATTARVAEIFTGKRTEGITTSAMVHAAETLSTAVSRRTMKESGIQPTTLKCEAAEQFARSLEPALTGSKSPAMQKRWAHREGFAARSHTLRNPLTADNSMNGLAG